MSTAEQMSFEEFLKWEPGDHRRYEWVGGVAYAMSGATERHDLIAGAIFAALRPGARAAGCRTFLHDRLLQTAHAGHYPDVLVCGPAAHLQHENDAKLIFEVRSPSTALIDRREKAIAYIDLPGLNWYIRVDPDEARWEIGTPAVSASGERRFVWMTAGPGDIVFTPFGTLVLESLYAEVDAEATT